MGVFEKVGQDSMWADSFSLKICSGIKMYIIYSGQRRSRKKEKRPVGILGMWAHDNTQIPSTMRTFIPALTNPLIIHCNYTLMI